MKITILAILLTITGCSTVNLQFKSDLNGCSNQLAGDWCDSQSIKSKTLRGEF